MSVRVSCLHHAATKTWKWITTTYSVGAYIHADIGTYVFYTYDVTIYAVTVIDFVRKHVPATVKTQVLYVYTSYTIPLYE